MSSIPKIIFGKCPRCGGGGGDYPASELTGADAQDNIVEQGNGWVLEWFQGDLMCEICRKEELMRQESLIVADNIREEELFRASAGFKRTIE